MCSQHFQTVADGLTVDTEQCLVGERQSSTESSAAQSVVPWPVPV